MGIVYGTIDGLYRHGVPRGSLTSRARPIASVDPDQDRFELEGHALAADAPLMLTVDAGGVLPDPLSTLTVYYAKLVELEPGIFSESLFQIAATAGGAAIDLLDEGTAPLRLALSNVPAALWKLETRSRWVDGFAYGHAVPFTTPYPVFVVDLCERAAAIDLRRDLGLIPDDQADAMLSSVAKDAERIMRGVPMRDAAATASSNLATGASPEVLPRQDTIP